MITGRIRLGLLALTGSAAVLVFIILHNTRAEAVAQSCPAALASAHRLVLVVAPSMDSRYASLQTFERRPRSRWRAVSGPQPAMLGANGVAWAHTYQSYAGDGEPMQVEGDNRSPAGVFPLGDTFGFDSVDRPLQISLERQQHICVDDLESPYYNRIVSRQVAGPQTHAEEMRDVPTYRRGIVIDLPTDRSKKTASCIFLHVWNDASVGTGGCIGLPESSVESLQEWGGDGKAAIAILPEVALGRLQGCLP